MAVARPISPQTGSAAIPEAQGSIPPTSERDMDTMLADLVAHKDAWLKVGVSERISLLEQLLKSTAKVAKGWVDAALKAKKIAPGTPAEAEEWLGGPMVTVRNLRLLKESLEDIREHGRPRFPGAARTRPDGQVVVPVFPTGLFDKLMYGGLEGEIWMEPEVTMASLADTQAVIYRSGGASKPHEGKVALVLGAGNVSSIGPMDALYKLFVEDQLVILKMNPVNEYTGPFVAQAFKLLLDRGFMRIAYGGVHEGAYLCQHAQVDEIHITGSDKTHDAIVFGVGAKGKKAKARTSRSTRSGSPASWAT